MSRTKRYNWASQLSKEYLDNCTWRNKRAVNRILNGTVVISAMKSGSASDEKRYNRFDDIMCSKKKTRAGHQRRIKFKKFELPEE